MTRARIIGLPIALAAALLALYAVFGDSSAPQNQKDSVWSVVIMVVVVAAIVFGVVVPWAARRSPGTAGLIVSVLGFLSIAAFWSGLPIVLGGAGATIGLSGEHSAPLAGKAKAAVVLGVVAAALGIAVTVIGNVAH